MAIDRPGGTGIFIDSGAPLDELFKTVERLRLRVPLLLTTHGHDDHTAGHEQIRQRFGARVRAHPVERVSRAEPVEDGEIVEAGGLRIRSLHTPGETEGGLSYVLNDQACFTGDVLYAGSIGGTRAVEELRNSIMSVLMGLSAKTDLHPGHGEATTVAREWNENRFIRVWRGLEPEGKEPCRVGGEGATLIVWTPDYDGRGKAWVRFHDGREAILAGSSLQRLR